MKTRPDLVRDKKITILGMARSGTAAAILLQKHGAEVFVSEMKPYDKVAGPAQTLEHADIDFETGGHTERALAAVDYVVISPGIPPTSPFMREIAERHLPVFSEVEVTSWLCRATIIAITGTNGKTTTTALVAHLLNTAGRKALATGNIGSPFATDAEKLTEDDFAVVEISSFQLEGTDTFKPKVASILNITPDHLDRYGGFEEYAEMKYRIADSQDETDYLILNYDDPILQQAKFWGKPQILHFSTKERVENGVFAQAGNLVYSSGGRSRTICPTGKLGIKGPHNLANAAAAAAMVLPLGIDIEAVARGLETFQPIEHRLEPVMDIKGVSFINDSKATNVDSVFYALQSEDRPLIVIMGGRDKAGDFSTLAALVKQHVKLIVLIGEATEKIEVSLGDVTATIRAKDIFEAVEVGYRHSAAGDVVMLSPACASFDQFTDYEDRGRKFKQAVQELARKEGGK
jgi:UDP-N-acetylmuramoylalanine--D-glutamate ligase